jgi:hypothetical protein
MYASLGSAHRDEGLLILELSEIGMADEGNVAHVMVRASGTLDASESSPAPESELVRLVRVRACWRLEHSASNALAD